MADKPGHIIEISDALGRDVDKAKAGKLKQDLPIEAFMTDAALSELAARNKPAEAVHAENLTAISPAEARRRQTFNGETLPDTPQVRRVIPAPFKRPSMTAGSHGKTWRHIRADKIRPDDIIPDIGLVTAVKEETVYSTRGEILGVEKLENGDFQLPTDWTQLGGKVIDFGDLSEKVAVGLAVVVIGVEGQVKAFRESDEVQVFRKHDES